jgi:thioredoxin reductase
VAELAQKPFPPGRYQLLIVGSGPGGLQLSYSLSRLGVDHALLSDDPGPGGMFRRWPVFQRMLSWTKPFAGVPHTARAYERYDWNSLLADEETNRAVMPPLMDGSSYFPSRPEMQRGLETFVAQTRIQVRYDCHWESTRREVDDFVLSTSDGEYRAPVVVFAVGVAQPYRPPIPGLDQAPHYGDFRPVETYRDHRVFIIGKQNSGFEIATGLLPWARQLVLASPSPTKLSVNTHTLVGVRARYVQPFEDAALAGGVIILDTTIEEVRKDGASFKVHTRNATDGRALTMEADDVIAATGFVTPLRDLPNLGVATFGQSRLPAQTPFWESATVPGIYFAGTITQGAAGLKKHGIPSNSGAVQGYRYNARVLARHLAESHFGVRVPAHSMDPSNVVPFLLSELSRGPELWHQRSYLARVVSLDRTAGIADAGILPLQHFLDSTGPDAVAVCLESNGQGNPYPVVYLRQGGTVAEHPPLPPHPLLDFSGRDYVAQLEAILEPVLSGTGAAA